MSSPAQQFTASLFAENPRFSRYYVWGQSALVGSLVVWGSWRAMNLHSRDSWIFLGEAVVLLCNTIAVLNRCSSPRVRAAWRILGLVAVFAWLAVIAFWG